MKKFVIIYTTTNSKKEAQKIAKTLVKEKLAACCNIFEIESVFFWKSRIEKNREWGIFIKTKETLFRKIEERIKGLHSYSLPCIISFRIQKGNKKFLEWIDHSTL